MAQTLKTYDVVCPDCDEDFKVARDPAELAKGDGDLIDCPNCYTEFEWNYDEEADTLELCGEDDFEDDGMDLTSESYLDDESDLEDDEGED